MDLKINVIENAAKAAKELGMLTIPWVWIKFMQSGWVIEPTSCSCGGNWAWLKPRPSGAKEMCGCVCHHELDFSKLIETKNATFSPIIKELLRNAKPKAGDVGKIFLTAPQSLANNTIMDREDFLNLDPSEVGWWIEIDELDIMY